MSRHAKVSIAAVFALMAAALVVASLRGTSTDREASRRAARSSESDIQSLRVALRKLEHAVESSRTQQQSRVPLVISASASQPDGKTRSDEGEGHPSPTFEERKRAELERLKTREQSIVTTMRLQVRDDVWASETEQAINERVSSLDPDRFETTMLESVTCRQSICEARMLHDSKREARAIFEEMARIPTVSAVFGLREDGAVEGSYETALFFGREGFRLPQ